jgi:hypothetical protein
MTSPQQNETTPPASHSIEQPRPHDWHDQLNEQRRQHDLIGAYPRTSEQAETVP